MRGRKRNLSVDLLATRIIIFPLIYWLPASSSLVYPLKYHVKNKYKMELINYPTPRRERRAADNGDNTVAAIGVVRNERGRSLSREDQGGRRDGGVRHSPSPLPLPLLLLPPR